MFFSETWGREGGQSSVSNPAVNLSVWCGGGGAHPLQDCLTSVQGRPVQHVNSSIDRCPIRASGCDQSCMLMSCRQTEDQLRTNARHQSITLHINSQNSSSETELTSVPQIKSLIYVLFGFKSFLSLFDSFKKESRLCNFLLFQLILNIFWFNHHLQVLVGLNVNMSNTQLNWEDSSVTVSFTSWCWNKVRS